VNRNRKGIVIITTMLLLSIVIMIAALLVVTGRSTLLLGASYSDREQAYYAAECGIAYAQYCLSRYKDWTASETTLDTIYDPGFTDFTVSAAGSQNNCVRGVLNSNGSEFYIAFYSGTWNDASSPKKDVDGSGNLGMKLKYYSYNNLSSSSGNQYTKYLDDTEKGKNFRTVPAGYAHIIVEGHCNQVRRYAEVILQKVDTKTGMACSIAANGIDVDLTDNDSVFLVDAASGYESRIRSMGDITVNSVNNDKNCYRIADGGLSCTGAGTESSPTSKYTKINDETIDSASDQTAYGISCENKPQGDYLEKAKLEWDDVTSKYISGTSYDSSSVKTTIKAGSYVYMNSSAYPDTYKLYYFPTSCTYNPDAGKKDDSHPDNFVTKNLSNAVEYSSDLISSSRSGDLSLLTTVTKTQLAAGGTYLMSAANPIGISADKNGGDFTIAVYDYQKKDTYSPSSSYRASVKLEGTSDQDPGLVSQTGGNIYVAGELSGKGKIMSGGELSFQGKSILEADTNSTNGVSIYAQGSVNIDPIKGSGGSTDASTYIKDAWNNLISTSKYTASGDYYTSGFSTYKDLQKALLATEVTYNGKNTQLSDVLKTGLKYDKAAIQEMINTTMSKNSYIGTDTSTSSSSCTVESGESSTVTYGGNTYNVMAYTDSGVPHLIIYESGKTVSDPEDATDVIRFHYYNGSASADTNCGYSNLSNLSAATALTMASYGTTNGWTLTASSKTNNESASTIMMHKTSSGFVDLSFNDTILKGLVYTWKDFKARDLGGNSLSIRGAVVAYGGNPASQDPGADSSYGKISLNNGKYITFTYDPEYMKLIFDTSTGLTTKRIMQNSF